ncbi:MAG: hypothetical protein HYU41_03450 [Candidatus Rokubacteria bacterium]|nr:hypothetical protein [Candidatus Rokubacteria bacterium]
MARPKSRFRPRDPEAVHRRFEEIKSRVSRRMDEEWSRLVRSQPRATGEAERREAPRGRPTARKR